MINRYYFIGAVRKIDSKDSYQVQQDSLSANGERDAFDKFIEKWDHPVGMPKFIMWSFGEEGLRTDHDVKRLWLVGNPRGSTGLS